MTSSSAAGRLLGMSVVSSYLGALLEDLLEDLLTCGSVLDIVERPVTASEASRSPRECPDLVAAVVRNGRLPHFSDPEALILQSDDRLIAIERATR